MATKQEILDYLNEKQALAGGNSSRFLSYAFYKMLIDNDIISPTQFDAEFPELT